MNIYVGNLPPDAIAEDLRRLFADFDHKARVTWVEQQTTGRLLRYGYVVIDAQAAAQRAVSALNGVELHGHSLHVREFIERAGERNRRAADSDEHPWYGPERRIVERRALVSQVVRRG